MQLAFSLLQERHQRADTRRLKRFGDDLVLRAAGIGGDPADDDHFETGFKFELYSRGRAAPNNSGNAGPIVWVDGRVVGGWSQRANGDVVYRLLERVDATTKKKLNAERDRLTEWFGGTRITPRFRSPLEKELAAQER